MMLQKRACFLLSFLVLANVALATKYLRHRPPNFGFIEPIAVDTSWLSAFEDTEDETTVMTTERALTPELRSSSLLQENEATLQETQLHLYRQKTQLSLIFLNEVLPVLQSIQKNMTELLKTSKVPLEYYRQTDDTLVNEMIQVEGRMDSNRHLVETYSASLKRVGRHLESFHKTLGSILMSHFNGTAEGADVNQTNDDFLEKNDEIAPSSEACLPIPTGPNVLRGCGGILKSNEGSIVYKYGEAIKSQNEGCLWTISPEQTDAGYIIFTLRTAQFKSDNQNFVSVGYFINSDYNNPSSFVWTKFNATALPNQKLEIPAPVAFVHFVSSSTVGTAERNQGFYLDFQASQVVSRPEFEYSSMFLSGPFGNFRYREEGSYLRNERAVIVVQPTFRNYSLSVNWWDLEADFFDFLSIWTFDRNVFEWNRKEMLTGRRSGSVRKNFKNWDSPRNDPIILTFQTDDSQEYEGFEFEWSSQP